MMTDQQLDQLAAGLDRAARDQRARYLALMQERETLAE